MALLTSVGQTFDGDTSVVDSTAKYALGTRAWDKSGQEYIYLLGVASTAANDAVTYNYAYATARAVADAVGPVAIAQAAIVASKYGWYGIKGAFTVAVNNSVSAGVGLYLTAGAGALDDAGVAGDWVANAMSGTANTSGTTGTITAYINYPMVFNSAYLT